ncbi:MAG: LrgB family protein [Firmicutes bacterium]|nr:LrgB family protein [Clostridiales bacterium]MBQ4340606.1 LrgB family protein [Bacillota bacterium]
MKEFLTSSVYFGVLISLMAYGIGMILKKKFKLAIFNPVLIAIVLIIAFLAVFDIDYADYNSGAKYISYLLTPATICLAVPLYEQFEVLKKNLTAVMMGITSGVITSLCCILALAVLFGLDHTAYVTFLPKSVTTAIGMGISEELGGNVAISVGVIIITGVLGNMFSGFICKVFHITEPIAKGIGIGSASHVIGTAKALEMGEVEGAMSSLSIVVAGLMTVAGAAVFANFL